MAKFVRCIEGHAFDIERSVTCPTCGASVWRGGATGEASGLSHSSASSGGGARISGGRNWMMGAGAAALVVAVAVAGTLGLRGGFSHVTPVQKPVPPPNRVPGPEQAPPPSPPALRPAPAPPPPLVPPPAAAPPPAPAPLPPPAPVPPPVPAPAPLPSPPFAVPAPFRTPPGSAPSAPAPSGPAPSAPVLPPPRYAPPSSFVAPPPYAPAPYTPPASSFQPGIGGRAHFPADGLDRLNVDGRLVRLQGVLPNDPRMRDAAEQLLSSATQGTNEVRCAVLRGGQYDCRALGSDMRIGAALIVNGIALADPAAPPEYRSWEDDARHAHRGLWATGR